MQDLTLPTAREDRDQLATRTGVLDKVGVLATLPDDMHANADQVATFYGTTREVIRQTVLRNKDEFDADGYRVLTRAEVSDELSLTPDELGMPRTAPSMSLFPRQAVLRVGMLLRDSPVARQVRDYLLDNEQDRRADVHFLVPKTLPDALRAYAAEVEAREQVEREKKVLTARIEKDEPLVAKAEAHSASDSMIHRQAFAREVQQWGTKRGVSILQDHVYELLRRKGMLVAGERSDRNHATSHAVKSGWAWTKKDVTETGHATATTYLNPRGQDIAWKWITAHVNEFGTLSPQGMGA